MIKFVLPVFLLGAYGLFHLLPESGGRKVPATLTEVERGDLSIWVQYDGSVQSRNEQPVYSRLSQRGIITELAPEGAQVEPGDVLVAFDQHDLKRAAVKLEEAFVLAESEYESLVKAELPMQRAEADRKLDQLRKALASEKRYLEDARELRARDLVSEQELQRQRTAVEEQAAQLAVEEEGLRLTREYIHPSALRRGQASLNAARQQRELAEAQLEMGRIVARRAGTVVYQPLHIDGEYRTVKVGDAVYRNQKFMILADMTDLAVTCEIPESQLSRVDRDFICEVTPAAFPSLKLKGRVEQIGTMAHTLAGRPAWQKFFTVTIRLEESAPRLRSGMSVQARINAYHRPDALLVPRVLVTWKNGATFCRKQVGRDFAEVPVVLGRGDDTRIEVLEGLQAGDLIVQ